MKTDAIKKIIQMGIDLESQKAIAPGKVPTPLIFEAAMELIDMANSITDSLASIAASMEIVANPEIEMSAAQAKAAGYNL